VVDGCVWHKNSKLDDQDKDKIKAIKDVVEDLKLSPIECDLYEWMANYYHYPVGQLIFDILPDVMKRPRKLSFDQGEGQDSHFRWTEEQAVAIETILKKGLDRFHKWLLHGVTGAGKTIVYLELIKK